MTGTLRKLWRTGATIFAVVVILLALLLGLFRLVLTQVPEHRDQIEAWAGQAIGLPVELASVDARLGLHGPELSFTGARMLAADSRALLLEAREGAISLDFRDLLRGRVVPGRISLAGVGLEMERDAEGLWRLLGPHGPALAMAGGLPRLEDVPVPQIRLEDVTVKVSDLQRGLGPWTFTLPAVDISAEGQALLLDAAIGLPPELGQGIEIRARLDGQDPSGLPLGWSGQLAVTGADLSAAGGLLEGEARWPVAGTLDARLQFAGSRLRPESLVGRLRLDGLELPGGAAGYDTLAGLFDYSRGATGWLLRISDLVVERQARRWRSPTARVEVTGNGENRIFYADADRLMLEDLAPFAALLPETIADQVRALEPRGELRSAMVQSGPASGAVSFRGQFADASVEPVRPVPGFSGLSGRFEGDLASGSYSLSGADVEMRAPWLFRQPLAAASLEGEGNWVAGDSGWVVEARRLAVASPDVTLEARGSIAVDPGDDSVRLDIDARAREIDLSSASSYLPVGIMPPAVVTWIDEAAITGRAPEALLEIRGSAGKFPYPGGEGVFRVSFRGENMGLGFAEGWPRAEAITADILFEKEGFYADVTDARMMAVKAGPVSVEIPQLKKGQLSIRGQASGSVADGRDWALATDMLRRILEAGLEPAQVRAGTFDAEVDLFLPLDDLSRNRVAVDLALADTVVDFAFLDLPVEEVAGRILVNDKQVRGENLAAAVGGLPVEIRLGPVGQGATRLSLAGRSNVETVSGLFGLERPDWASGGARYEGYLEFPAGGAGAFNLRFGSDLDGVKLDLPAPLGKPGGIARQVSLAVSFPSEDIQDWRVSPLPGLEARLRTTGQGADRALATVAAVPAGAPVPEQPGLVVWGSVDTVSLGEWIKLLATDQRPEGRLPLAAADLRIGQLEAPTGRYPDVGLAARPGDGAWRLDISGEHLRGRVTLPEPLYDGRRVEADLERLDLFPPTEDEAEAASVETGEDNEGPPRSVPPEIVPPAFITVDDLRIGEIRLGTALLDVRSLPGGFEVARFDGGGETYKFTGKGRSVQTPEEDETDFSLTLSSTDIEATAATVGYAPVMSGESGLFEARASWKGGLRSDFLTAMRGSARLAFDEGRLTTVSTGAGRIFGLLSLQALPRRLMLDFSDLAGGGLPYDEIRGDFEIVGGDAYTTNLVLRGPSIDMGVVGLIGLADQDYDQVAVVSADLGAAVPMAGALAGGPIVGAALWVLSEALRNPLRSQFTYRVTGPWDDPVVERVSGREARPPPGPAGAADQTGEPAAGAGGEGP
ncbi:MAG: YhdP family protein [Gammaproteobacteria bacterium]